MPAGRIYEDENLFKKCISKIWIRKKTGKENLHSVQAFIWHWLLLHLNFTVFSLLISFSYIDRKNSISLSTKTSFTTILKWRYQPWMKNLLSKCSLENRKIRNLDSHGITSNDKYWVSWEKKICSHDSFGDELKLWDLQEKKRFFLFQYPRTRTCVKFKLYFHSQRNQKQYATLESITTWWC